MVLNSKEEPDSIVHPGTNIGTVAKEVGNHKRGKAGGLPEAVSIKGRGDLRSIR